MKLSVSIDNDNVTMLLNLLWQHPALWCGTKFVVSVTSLTFVIVIISSSDVTIT